MYEPNYTDSLRADILPSYNDSLMHHGIKGMHWGVRRYQNPDGSYTSAGKARRGMSDRTKKNFKRAAIGAAALGAAGLAGYGLYKMRSRKNKDSLDDYTIVDKHGNKVDENDPRVQEAIEKEINRRNSRKSPLGLPAYRETSYDNSPVTRDRREASRLRGNRDIAIEDYTSAQNMLDRDLNQWMTDEDYNKSRPAYVTRIVPRARKKAINANQEYVDFVNEHPYVIR